MNPGVYSYSEDYTYFTTYGKAGYTPLETSSVEAYGSYIQSLDYSNFASYTADDEESLAEFGLDDPEFKLVIQYTDTSGEEDEDVTLVLAYGTNGEDYVVRIGDSRVICLLDEDTYLFIRDLDIDEYRPNDLLDIDWDLATSIEVTLDGSRYTFAMADEDSEDEDAPDYTNIRKAINNLGVERYTEDAEIGKLELSLVINLDNERYPSLNISIYRHNGDSCIVRWGGDTYCVVERRDVVDLIEYIYDEVL